MRTVKFMVNYGGYIGTDEEFAVVVDDNATDAEIEAEIETEFQQIIQENCSWELCEDDEEASE